MNKDLQNLKEIDSYLAGDLDSDKLLEFEVKLKGDIDLQEEVKIIKQLIEGIQGYGFKKMLQEIHEENFGNQ
jgi:hypothetical protein